MEKHLETALLYSTTPLAAVGAVAYLKTLGNQAAILLWNYIHCEIQEGRMPSHHQIRAKFMGATDETILFWKVNSSQDEILPSNWSDPKSFEAPDKDSAQVYAEIVLQIKF